MSDSTTDTYPLATCSGCINWNRANMTPDETGDRGQAICSVHNAKRYGSEHCVAFVRKRP